MPLGPSRVAHCFAVSMQCPTGHRRQRAEPSSLTAAALPRIRWKNRRDSGSSTGAPANGMVHVGSRAIGPRWPTTSQDPGGLLWDPLWLWSKLAAGKLDLVVAELGKLHKHLLGPLGVGAVPQRRQSGARRISRSSR